MEGPNLLQSVLDELWDFDTRISSDGLGNPAPADFLHDKGKPIRGYYQSTATSFAAAVFKAVLPDNRWRNYYDMTANGNTPPVEIPALPPGPYNDTGVKDSPHTGVYRHHLIREFMFLDAVANNDTRTTHPVPLMLQTDENRFLVVRRSDFGFADAAEAAQVSKFTQGPGRHPINKLLLDDSTFVEQGASLLDFETKNVGFTALLYELQERTSPGVAANVVPNWFGVAVPDDITDFRNVILYFHPSPDQTGAGYKPAQYQTKSGPPGTNWKELFAYVDRLGNQLAGAATTSQDLANQIVIFPFMKEHGQVGILPKFWFHIVRDILSDIQANGV